MSLVVLDTDVASFSLRNRLPNQLRAALAGHTMCITFVTVGELMKWRVLRSWGPSRTDELARWRQHVGVLAYDEAVADKWVFPEPPGPVAVTSRDSPSKPATSRTTSALPTKLVSAGAKPCIPPASVSSADCPTPVP